MGALDQFAKATFAAHTEEITRGAIVWEGPQEVGLTEVRLDGLLSVRAADRATGLPAPWGDAARHADVVIEMKMPGDHLHPLAIRRAELRRAAWHVRRNEKQGAHWNGSVGLWLVAPHVPDVLQRLGPLHPKAPGCYALGHEGSGTWWIAANELPLHESLIPLLVARSGVALLEFARWVVGRRGPEWTVEMLRCVAMSQPSMRELMKDAYPSPPTPEFIERNRQIADWLLNIDVPQIRDAVRATARAVLQDEVRTAEARRLLQRVLARRGFAPTPEIEARVDACSDLPTLERWLDQAVTAASVDEALA